MEHLRSIADDRKIVMVITHTPDRVIDLFDKVIVLAKGIEDHIGHLAYYGTIPEARSFFGRRRHTGRLGQVRIYLGKFFRIFIYEKDWKVLPLAGTVSLEFVDRDKR